jgi:hypothetical protein
VLQYYIRLVQTSDIRAPPLWLIWNVSIDEPIQHFWVGLAMKGRLVPLDLVKPKVPKDEKEMIQDLRFKNTIMPLSPATKLTIYTAIKQTIAVQNRTLSYSLQVNSHYFQQFTYPPAFKHVTCHVKTNRSTEQFTPTEP